LYSNIRKIYLTLPQEIQKVSYYVTFNFFLDGSTVYNHRKDGWELLAVSCIQDDTLVPITLLRQSDLKNMGLNYFLMKLNCNKNGWIALQNGIVGDLPARTSAGGYIKASSMTALSYLPCKKR